MAAEPAISEQTTLKRYALPVVSLLFIALSIWLLRLDLLLRNDVARNGIVSFELARTGAAADVDYTFAKYVRKGRGMRPGLVLLIRHQTLRVRLEAGRIERLLHSTEAPEEPGEPGEPPRVDPSPGG